ncbi:hypothetical protein Q0590_36270 [Rhodocytophaga aerolata]|uniref:Uncharacterized protein n=1 Tax=Rhodocytophaga aerolata TaxID=455078 RepID=A0ABT8RI53_9BACT|nr:hypothetical protein [Rhodocytophaga aerolata]MDO1451787.1 hypothetical protein [Rhodocytophaga aerolata]
MYLSESNNFITRYVTSIDHSTEINLSTANPTLITDSTGVPTPHLKLLIFSYFEYILFYSPNRALEILQAIEKLLIKKDIRLLIVSQKDPVQLSQAFLESIDRQKIEEKLLIQQILNRWQKVVGNFNQQFYHINTNYPLAGHTNGKADELEKPKSARPSKALQSRASGKIV